MRPNKTEEENPVRFLRPLLQPFGSNNSSTLTCCCTLPFPFLPPFPSPIFHRRTSKTIKDRSTRPLERKEGLFFFNFTTIQWNNPAISLLFLFSFRTDVEKVFWGKHGGSMLNGSGKIFERGKFGLRLFFCFLHILCGWIWIVGMCVWIPCTMEQACNEK